MLFQIPIATSGIRAMGFLMRHHLRTEGLGVNQRIVTQFVKVKRDQHTSVGHQTSSETQTFYKEMT